jgi:polysaccharide biosynthesis transport protein
MKKKQPAPEVSNRHLSARDTPHLPELKRYDELGSPYFFETREEFGEWEGLLEFWRLLVRHKTAILFSSIGGLLVGVLVGIPLKPVYRASTTLEVLNVNEDFMNMRPTQSALPAEDTDNLSEEETQATLLQSTQLLDRVSARLNAKPTPLPQPAVSGWRAFSLLNERPKSSAREKLLGAAIKSLKITNPPRTRILEISVDSTDSQLALDFTNVLVQEFIKQNVETRWASTQQTGDWLKREIDDARKKLQDSEDALQSYASRSGLFFIDDQKQTNVATEKLQEIQQQLSTATADRIAKQSSFELAKHSPPDAIAEVLNDPNLQALSARIDDATRQVASLTAIYNPGYPKLQEAQAEVASLQQAFATHRADLLRRIETDYQSANRREKLLANAYDAQAGEVAGQDQRAVQYNILKREVDSNRQLYDTMLQQMKQASIATALRASNVHIVYPAFLLDRPVFPNFKMNATLGLLVGFLSSLGMLLIRERTDRTLRQPGEVKQWVRLPELGTIPRFQCRGGRSMPPLRSQDTRNGDRPSGERALITGGLYNLSNLAAISDAPVAIPEAFHSALTSILLAGETRGPGRVLVFTSAGPADGKTSVVSNIAIAAAANGKKVLLVDADLRRPRIHDIFGLKNDAGMAELLRCEGGAVRWPEFMRQTIMPGLSVITAGQPKRGAGRLLYSPDFSGLLAKWREQFDLVLLDTPPALPITDARVIGILADGVVLVARAGQTTRDALLAAHERFAEDRIHLLGCILNDWDPRHASRTYPGYLPKQLDT